MLTPRHPAVLCAPAPGAILFEETLFQDTRKGTSMVDELNKNVSRVLAPATHAPGLC